MSVRTLYADYSGLLVIKARRWQPTAVMLTVAEIIERAVQELFYIYI